MQPGSISTQVVIEEVGDAAEGGSGSVGGALLSIDSGPFDASLTCSPNASARAPRAKPRAQLVSAGLQRAVVGWVRVGVRRVDAHTVALVLASPAHAARVAQAQACGLLVPLPPLTYQLKQNGQQPGLFIPTHAARALFGLRPAAEPPATMTTDVVLEVEGGSSAPPSRGPFNAAVRVHRGSQATWAVQLSLVCPDLQRAVVGWQRVGMRRVDADTVALVLAWPGSLKAQGGHGRR